MSKPKGKIYLIPSTISEQTEQHFIAPAVLQIISHVNYYLVENIRTSRRYISKLMKLLPEKDRKPIESLKFEIVDKNTTEEQISELISPVINGTSCGILSESGCPGIADPGSEVIRKGHLIGIKIIPVPGPSSIFLALMASGMNGQNFAFHGYLPIDKKILSKKIKQLESNAVVNNQTQIFIETPYRNQKMMDALLHSGNPETLLCIATDITGANENIVTQSISRWRKQKISLPKLPAVFLIYS